MNTVRTIRDRVPIEHEAALQSNVTPGAITEAESIALAHAIKFVNAEQWQRAGLRIPFRPREDASELSRPYPDGASAALYIIQYSMRMYGLMVVDDLPDAVYSGWLESADQSPITEWKEAPLFYWSANRYVREVTNITPSTAFVGSFAGRGLGDAGQGGLEADNGFISDANGRAYWPMYWRGILLGGVMPYSAVAFANQLMTPEERGQLGVQVVNGQHSVSDRIIKVAWHSDNKLHGWIPGSPGTFEVRWILHWGDVDIAIKTQAPIEMKRNTHGGQNGIIWFC